MVPLNPESSKPPILYRSQVVVVVVVSHVVVVVVGKVGMVVVISQEYGPEPPEASDRAVALASDKWQPPSDDHQEKKAHPCVFAHRDWHSPEEVCTVLTVPTISGTRISFLTKQGHVDG